MDCFFKSTLITTDITLSCSLYKKLCYRLAISSDYLETAILVAGVMTCLAARKCYDLLLSCCYLSTAYCPGGKELVNGKCEKCQRGFYKSNDKMNARFDRCKACSLEFITKATGSTHEDNCNIGKLLSLAGTRGRFPNATRCHHSDILILGHVCVTSYNKYNSTIGHVSDV